MTWWSESFQVFIHSIITCAHLASALVLPPSREFNPCWSLCCNEAAAVSAETLNLQSVLWQNTHNNLDLGEHKLVFKYQHILTWWIYLDRRSWEKTLIICVQCCVPSNPSCHVKRENMFPRGYFPVSPLVCHVFTIVCDL